MGLFCMQLLYQMHLRQLLHWKSFTLKDYSLFITIFYHYNFISHWAACIEKCPPSPQYPIFWSTDVID